MTTKTALATPSPNPRRHRDSLSLSKAAMLEAEINQQLAVAHKFKNLLWTKILEQATPEQRQLLEAYGSLETADNLFPRYAQITLPLRARLEWLVRANVEAERRLKGKA